MSRHPHDNYGRHPNSGRARVRVIVEERVVEDRSRRVSLPPPQRQEAPRPRPVQPQRQFMRWICTADTYEKYDLYKPELGQGAFGTVWPCWNKDTGWIAVKEIEKSKSDAKAARNEVSTLRALSGCHPNIIRYITSISLEQHRYYMFELADGGSLKNAIAAESMSDEDKKSVVKQILLGVEFLDENGVVHCDLKPDNVIFSRPGLVEAKIIDFGASQHLKKGEFGKKVSRITRAAAYASPETVELIISRTSDSWSIGIILWVMYQGPGHYPVNPPDFSSKGKSRKHIAEEFRAECGKLSNPGLWARWRGPLGAVPLCQRMLDVDMCGRISASEALLDRWVLDPPITIPSHFVRSTR